MPGSMIGFDKEGNIVSLQVVGQLDGHGLLKSTMISDLFLMRIAESEGVMELIRQGEKKSSKMLGTVLIIDLEGLSIEKLDFGFIKLITTLLAQLQDLFPDVLKKVFIIRSPSFLQLLWSAIQPVLAKQTQQKIHFLGADWKIQLQQNIGEDLLYSHWGGSKHSIDEYGDIRMGGKVPASMYYDLATDPFYDPSKTTKITIGPKKFVTVDLIVEDIIWPKFRLLTEHVPECRKLLVAKPGVYRMCLENLHGKFWNKKVEYSAYCSLNFNLEYVVNNLEKTGGQKWLDLKAKQKIVRADVKQILESDFYPTYSEFIPTTLHIPTVNTLADDKFLRDFAVKLAERHDKEIFAMNTSAVKLRK
uniref:CRAL-TRIO domain-containing protein n=1 Tax=Ditylenchus dipsaci TaxID=166011 RepID=A0A915E828_9BILA